MQSDKFHEKLKNGYNAENSTGLYSLLSSRTLSSNQVDYLLRFIIELPMDRYSFVRMMIDNPYIYLTDDHYCMILKDAIEKSEANEYFGYTYSTIFSCVARTKDISKLLEMHSSITPKQKRSSFGNYVLEKIILKINRFYKKRNNLNYF